MADLSKENTVEKFDDFSGAWTDAGFSVYSIKELARLTDENEENLDKIGAKKALSRTYYL